MRSIRSDFVAEIVVLLAGCTTAAWALSTPWLIPAIAVLLAATAHRLARIIGLQHAATHDAKTGLLTAAAWTELATAASPAPTVGSDLQPCC